MNGDEFGPLTGLVGTVGSLFAAGVAIALTWRGRARWEPSETDIAKGPERVGGLVTAVLIVILFVVTRPQGSGGLLPVLAIFLLVVCVASLLAYSYITGTNTYDDGKRDRKIIGGFKLTPRAKREMRTQKLTEQRFFSTVDYDPDEVWPRSSRSLAKLVFVALYLLLVVSGTVAIAAAADPDREAGNGTLTDSLRVARTLVVCRAVDDAVVERVGEHRPEHRSCAQRDGR